MRRMWIAGAGLLALALVSYADAPIVAAQSTRPTVALLDFDFGSVQQWWSGNWDIGKGISDMLVDELVNDGWLSPAGDITRYAHEGGDFDYGVRGGTVSPAQHVVEHEDYDGYDGRS